MDNQMFAAIAAALLTVEAQERARQCVQKDVTGPGNKSCTARKIDSRKAAQERGSATSASSGTRRGQAIAIGMLADLGRQDKDGRTPADLCGFEFRPAGVEQDNVVQRYLDVTRALGDPAIEGGFLSVLSAIVAELVSGAGPDVEHFQKILKLRPESLAVPASGCEAE